ncbi:MAG: DNA/RNA nuclease SfsA [Leptospiraceae bacterium]|nr:DNA/RNA nuclease SfsA [Leptospiraceae bacterium]
MRFESKLLIGHCLRRYKRFLVDVEMEEGERITAHCPNPGSMRTSLRSGWRVALSERRTPGRRLPWTLELSHNHRCWIGLNTTRANAIVREALELNRIPELTGYQSIQPEVPYNRSRLDFLLSKHNRRRDCFLEIKSVTHKIGRSYAFPDARTERGRRHLSELGQIRREKQRAVLLFLVQRSDGDDFRAAEEVDPEYARALRQAHRAGVEMLVYGTRTGLRGIELTAPIPLTI